MINHWLFVMTFFSALGCGLVAGIFFAFSSFVMKALARVPPAQGIAAMQSINITVINPWFMAAFLGTAMACALVVVFSLLRWSEAGAVYLLSGGFAVVHAFFNNRPVYSQLFACSASVCRAASDSSVTLSKAA